MEREVGGGIGMGNTCKPMAVSFQCMTKSTTNKKKKFLKIIKGKKRNSCLGTLTPCGMFGFRYFLHLSPKIWQSMSWSYLVILRPCKLNS